MQASFECGGWIQQQDGGLPPPLKVMPTVCVLIAILECPIVVHVLESRLVISAGVTALCWAGDRLYSGGADPCIKTWDVTTRACLNTILPPSGPGTAAPGAGFSMALAARAAGAVAPDAAHMNGHTTAIIGLDILNFSEQRFLVSGSLDGCIKVRSTRTGQV